MQGKFREGRSLGVRHSPKTGETLEESRNPLDVPASDCISEVVQLNPQESTHLPQIFDRPSCGCSAELGVSCVDVRAMFHQRMDDVAMPAKCRVVKGRSAGWIPLVDKFRMAVGDLSHIRNVATLRGLNELLEVVH